MHAYQPRLDEHHTFQSNEKRRKKFFHVPQLGLLYGDRCHLDGGEGLVVSVSLDIVDGVDNIHTGNDFAKNRVLGRRRSIEEVEEGVVGCVDKELRSARVRLSSVGHGKGADLVGELGARGLSELVRHGAIGGASDSALAWYLVGRLGGRSASASTARGGVSRVGAAELVHEIGDHTVEVESIVEATLGEVNKVVCSERHLLSVELHSEGAHGCVDSSVGRHFGRLNCKEGYGYNKLYV